MKKLIGFLIIFLVISIALSFITSYQNKEEALLPETTNKFDDPNYQNAILPEELAGQLAEEETVTVYFHSPRCGYCLETTPIITPITKDIGIDLKSFNLLEFPNYWGVYGIEGTPTVVHYENGKEVKRIVGLHEAEVFEDWFKEIKK